MSTHNPYAWMAGLAAAHAQAELLQSKKARLTLITAAPPKNERKPRMKKTTEITQTPSAVHRKRLADEARMVHNALEAVRCLAIPSQGTGFSSSGVMDDMANVGRNHFVDLLEIINSRLGAALELDEPCH